MKHEIIWPKGGTNKMWEHMHIKVFGLEANDIIIHGLTWGRDGSQVIVLDKKGSTLASHRYDYHWDLSYENQIAKDLAADINLIFEIMGLTTTIEAEDLRAVGKEIRHKCESRYGNRLPNSEYEVLVEFAA